MASARCYLIITGAYVKIVTNLIRALFCLKASYVQGASKKKKFCTKCSSSNYFRKQHFLDCLTSLLPPSTFFIFPLKSLSSLLIMLVCQNVVWHRCQRFWIIKKEMLFSFLSNFSCAFLRCIWFLPYQVFSISWNLWWATIYQTRKTSFCYNCYFIFIKILFFSITLSLFLHEVLQ